jgi:hypothetical protein
MHLNVVTDQLLHSLQRCNAQLLVTIKNPGSKLLVSGIRQWPYHRYRGRLVSGERQRAVVVIEQNDTF